MRNAIDNAFDYALPTAIGGFVVAGIAGAILGVCFNPSPSCQQIWDASVKHYDTTAGENATEEGREAVLVGYFRTVGLGGH